MRIRGLLVGVAAIAVTGLPGPAMSLCQISLAQRDCCCGPKAADDCSTPAAARGCGCEVSPSPASLPAPAPSTPAAPLTSSSAPAPWVALAPVAPAEVDAPVFDLQAVGGLDPPQLLDCCFRC